MAESLVLQLCYVFAHAKKEDSIVLSCCPDTLVCVCLGEQVSLFRKICKYK